MQSNSGCAFGAGVGGVAGLADVGSMGSVSSVVSVFVVLLLVLVLVLVTTVAVVPASDPTSSGEALGAVDVGSGATGSGAFTPG